ncbi:TPA: hypothetical protein ACTXXA_002042 [Legionella anisa]
MNHKEIDLSTCDFSQFSSETLGHLLKGPVLKYVFRVLTGID